MKDTMRLFDVSNMISLAFTVNHYHFLTVFQFHYIFHSRHLAFSLQYIKLYACRINQIQAILITRIQAAKLSKTLATCVAFNFYMYSMNILWDFVDFHPTLCLLIPFRRLLFAGTSFPTAINERKKNIWRNSVLTKSVHVFGCFVVYCICLHDLHIAYTALSRFIHSK